LLNVETMRTLAGPHPGFRPVHDIRGDEEALGRAQKESFSIGRAGFLKVRRHAHVRERSEVIRLVQEAIDLRKDTLHSQPPRQRNQIKKGKSGRRLQNIDIQIKAEDVDLFDVDEDGNLTFMLALAPLDDLPEKSEVIRLVQETSSPAPTKFWPT
jgi:hypothetical protein